MHRDLIKLEWLVGEQVLMERIGPDDPRAEGPDRWKQALEGWASYVRISEAHAEADCPFKDSDRIRNLEGVG